MKNYLYISLFFLYIPITSNAQQTNTFNESISYIKNYYSSFETGYDFDGKYIVITENYIVTFSNDIFTLTFDSVDENKNIQNKTITINLSEVNTIEPYGTDVVEVFGKPTLIVPLSGKLALFTNTETYEINIYYEVDEDVERTQIYKSFKKIIETLKN